MPAEFITMISESVDSLLRMCAAAMTSAIGAITRTSSGMISPVRPMKTRMVWPWLVMMSMSRSAWVTQITAVRRHQHDQERHQGGAHDITVD